MKFHYDAQDTEKHLCFLIGHCAVATVETDDYLGGLRIFREYHFSWWDSLIVATALRADCSTFLSEDMQNGFVVDGRLTIVNPFV